MEWAKTTARRDEKHFIFVFGAAYTRVYGNYTLRPAIIILGQCTSDRKQCTNGDTQTVDGNRNACSRCRFCVLYQIILEWYPTRRDVVTYVTPSRFAYDLANMTWDNNNRSSIISPTQTNQLGNVANELSGNISIVVMVALLYFDRTSMDSKEVKLDQPIWHTHVNFTLKDLCITHIRTHTSTWQQNTRDYEVITHTD